MPHILVTTVVTLVTGASQPSVQPPNVSYLAKLCDTEQRVHQLDQQFQRINSQLDRDLTKQFFEFSVPAPSTIELPAIIDVHPYGPSFQFNGLTVHVEPIEVSSARVSTPSGPAAVEILHPLSREPVTSSPAMTSSGTRP